MESVNIPRNIKDNNVNQFSTNIEDYDIKIMLTNTTVSQAFNKKH